MGSVQKSHVASRLGILYLVSGPSGSGKTTLCRRLAEEGEAVYARSCTTRPMRPGEQNGVDYFFLSPVDFLDKVTSGEFIEHAEVHGNHYGTLKSEVLAYLEAGRDVVMDIDVQGAALVRNCTEEIVKTSLLDLFVSPPDHAEILQRLAGRGTDSEDVIALRMANALEEIAHAHLYSHLLESTDRESDYDHFLSLLKGARLATRLRSDAAAPLVPS